MVCRRGSVDGSGTLLRGTSSVGSGLMRGLSTECGTPGIEDMTEEEMVSYRSSGMPQPLESCP